MSAFRISGPAKLAGEIEVLGAKNAAMKMIAASILIKNKVVLKNVPDILDIENIIEILAKNNAEIRRDEHTLEINTTNLTDIDPDAKLVEKMRGSVVLIGPYLARFGHIKIPQPGGCAIGVRPIATHIDAFRQLDVQVVSEENNYELETGGLIGHVVDLREASVTATENILMATVLARGTSQINNAAKEPEIVDLANFLNQAGAKISGAGTETIIIEGVEKLNSIEYEVIPDRIETATFVALAIMTQSPLKITHCRPEHLKAFLDTIQAMGVEFTLGADYIQINKANNLQAIEVQTAVYPGFATDMQALMGLIMTQAQGESRLHEALFENRLGYLRELLEMGAKVQIINSQEAIITGPVELHGSAIESLDLRAGATLILAALAARGETTIDPAETIDRGYEKIEERLTKVGARIERI